MNSKEQKCVFCQNGTNRIIDETELSHVIYDNFPVSNLHTLIIPNRHVSDFFELYQPEIDDLFELLKKHKNRISSMDNNVTGFNVGINIGKDAGQTVMHCHIHLIPRRNNDTPDPRGGVRGVIPGKQKYNLL